MGVRAARRLWVCRAGGRPSSGAFAAPAGRPPSLGQRAVALARPAAPGSRSRRALPTTPQPRRRDRSCQRGPSVEAGAGAFSALRNLGLRAHVGIGAARPRLRRCRAVRSATSVAPITSPATRVRPRRRHSPRGAGERSAAALQQSRQPITRSMSTSKRSILAKYCRHDLPQRGPQLWSPEGRPAAGQGLSCPPRPARGVAEVPPFGATPWTPIICRSIADRFRARRRKPDIRFMVRAGAGHSRVRDHVGRPAEGGRHGAC